ncbi:hypothetical protein Lal_00012956 [Lupinus albus]|uniref:Putative transcription factor C2H2 family n=1 Tax=Lupinus albus TaxID=3870 RepID=A0A6A4NIZ6_LUPAL|nr:putative transcription factor C2H2 family [Lupinus albus]KAF1883996.1 hypothetical protein Lal_00012956 [Lupinus albus]
MSSLDNNREKLAGLTLNDVLANQKRLSGTPPSEPKNRTLLDIIKEDESNKKDRRSWKAFKDKLRVKRAGSAWTSSIHIPTSDPLIQFHHMSTNYNTHQVDDLNSSPTPVTKPQFSRRSSTRYGSPGDSSGDDSSSVVGGGGALRPMLSRRNSTTVPSQSEPYRRGRVVTFRDSLEDDDSDDEMNSGSERVMSAREAVAAQEASEAAAAEAEMAEEEEEQPMTMSLMDLLEETDREMGLEGSRYILSDDDFDEDDDDDEGDDDDDDDGEDAMEYTCCICMVKHKGSAFITCGHTFCRMCSRELNVSRGNCPLCNNFILEVLHIF